MKKLVLLIVTFLLITTVFGQPEQSQDVEKGIMKINFLPISFSYEFRVDEDMTVMVRPSFGFNFTNNSGAIYFSPQVTSFFRYYYNIDKRNAKGKRTAKNSVNYVGAVMLFSFWNAAWSNNVNPEDFIRYFAMGPVWGIQRNYSKHFSLGINLGPLIAVGNQGVRADAIVELTLGFWINHKK